MIQAKTGDKIAVNYTGKFSDGTVFDASCDKKPLIFTIGAGKVINGFENELIGMCCGEKKTIFVKSDNAYGPVLEQLIFDIEKNLFPESITPAIGLELEFKQENGKILFAKIININNEKVTVNANHPLAGKDLIFEVELVRIY